MVADIVEDLPMAYDVEAIRKKLKQTMSGKFSDPDEFRPEKAKSATEPIKYRFFFLPPIAEGDRLKTGVVKRGMDIQFFVQHGNHWVNDKPYPCPRVWDGTHCPICSFGFDLLKDDKIKNDEDKRRAVLKQWMPTQYYMVNVYFANIKENPEDLRGRVMFYNAPKTVIDKCTACTMRDDAGDPEAPEAFGVFFDENNGFLFELQVLKQGRQNSYKTSRFFPNAKPMVRNADGSANAKGIAALLQLRHNLFDKVEVPDLNKIQKIYEVMSAGDDSSDDKKGGFDVDETAPAATTAGKKDPGRGKVTQTAKTTTVTKPKLVAVDEEEDDAASLLAQAMAKEPETAAKPATNGQESDDDPLAAEAPLAEEPQKEPVAVGGEDVSSEEIDSLLSQLEDND
jgi:hypothetical protein